MIQFSVDAAWSGKRLDRFLFAHCGDCPSTLLYKAFRKRDVRVNNKRSRPEQILSPGDIVTAYLPTQSGCQQMDPASGNLSGKQMETAPSIPQIQYEDDQLLIVLKPQGIAVQRTKAAAAAGGNPDLPMDERVRSWWAQNRHGLSPGFPALCHRLDRNTGGLLMLAKTEEARVAVSRALKHHEIRKLYQCVVTGTPVPAERTVDAWLEKDAQAGRVYIHESPQPRSVPIRTRYRVLGAREDLSLLEVEIVTGRTHQIRAQLARLGHPILGDSRYGSNAANRRHGVFRQLLWACALQFGESLPPALRQLRGKQVASALPAALLPEGIRCLLEAQGGPQRE